MKTSSLLAGLSLAASLLLTPIHSIAQSAAPLAGKPTSAPPSILGGAPIQVAVYNYLKNPATPYWVTPNGVLQPLPGAGPVPPMTGSTPTILQSFGGATLVLRGPKGGGGWKHFALKGFNPSPFFVIGNPPPGAALPPGFKGGVTAAPAPTTPPAPGTVVNKTVVNNPPTPVIVRKRGAKAPDVNVTINPSAPSDAPAPGDPSSPAAAPAVAQSDDLEGALNMLTADDPRVIEFLRIHNAARADVGVAPLQWSDDLAFTAQDWADRLGRTGKIQHRPKSEYGENIGWGTGPYTAASAANAWLAEKAKYSPEAKKKKGQGAADETGHYTQMVWGKSTMVGFGLATTKDGRTVVVANYNPRGNIAGEKPYGP